MKLVCIILIIIVMFNKMSVAQNYSRSLVQTKHPGFGTEWIPLYQDDGSITIGYFNEPANSLRINFGPEPEDVTFTLYTRQNPDGTIIDNEDKLIQYDATKPTKFVTHGWMSSGTSDTCILIKNGFLEKYDANVFVMDWKKVADNVIYPIPMKSTTAIASFYATFLNNLIDKHGGDPKSFHLVGHSLGAHVSGFAARDVRKGKIGRITGLDPALPGFDIGLVDGGHLNQTDADFVDVIHTCAGFLGMRHSLGHVDFYPNGGSPPQPGCGNILEMVEACSHGRSWRFFAESLKPTVSFMAYRCGSYKNFISQMACHEEPIPMGDSVPETARGDYYLKTDSEPPFDEGAVEDELYNMIPIL